MKTTRGLLLASLIGCFCVACDLSSNDGSHPTATLDAGGGSGGDASLGCVTLGNSSPPSSLPSQCTDLATAFCTQEARCDTVDMQAYFAGDLATCVARMLLACPDVSESGTSNTPTSIEACATTISQISSCPAFAGYLLANDGLPCRLSPGTLPGGSACSDDSQCAGGFCAPPSGGVAEDGAVEPPLACAERPAAPNCQENAQCPGGQLCNVNGVCLAAGGAGAACDNSFTYNAVQPCQAGLYCRFGAPNDDAGPMTGDDAGTLLTEDAADSFTPGTCAALATVGQPCNPSDDANDCADGLYCTEEQTCASIQFVGPGAPCGTSGVLCAAATCATASDGGSICNALASDGAPCEEDADCEYRAYCSSGKCTPNPTICF